MGTPTTPKMKPQPPIGIPEVGPETGDWAMKQARQKSGFEAALTGRPMTQLGGTRQAPATPKRARRGQGRAVLGFGRMFG